jgi:hypothetical protein
VNLLTRAADVVPAQLLAVLLTAAIGVIGYFLRPRVRIIWGQKTNFTHVLRPKKDGQVPVRVDTAHYIIQNSGRAPAKEVEVVLNYAPDEVSIWPQRSYQLSTNNENRLIVKLEFLAPREFIDLILLNVANELPDVLSVKSPDCVGKLVNIGYHRVFPKAVYFLMIGGMFFGAVFFIEKLILHWSQ